MTTTNVKKIINKTVTKNIEWVIEVRKKDWVFDTGLYDKKHAKKCIASYRKKFPNKKYRMIKIIHTSIKEEHITEYL